MEFTIVPDQACPSCGAYWGNPDKSLDFPNRIKVDNDWKCYNPDCEVGYYRDGVVIELVPTPKEQAQLDIQMDDFRIHLDHGNFVPIKVDFGEASQFVPGENCPCNKCVNKLW